MNATKTTELSGLQPHSVGDTYPLSVSYRDDGETGHAYVWDLITGREYVRFEYFRSAGGYYAPFAAANVDAHEYCRQLAYARRLVARALSDGGFTAGRDDEAPPASGYMVSVGEETVIPIQPGESLGFPPSPVALDDAAVAVLGFMRGVTLCPGEYFGGWVHNGQLVLDNSVHVDDYQDACQLGRDHGQKAIYELETGLTLFLN